MSLQPRDYRDAHTALSGDLVTLLQQSADAIDCLLYLPDTAHLETVTATPDVVGAIESSERTIPYATAIPTRAMLAPPGDPLDMVNASDLPLGDFEQPVTLFIEYPDVPKHAIIEYEEYVSETAIRKVGLYVKSSVSVAQGPGAIKKYFCIPTQAFEEVALLPDPPVVP